MGKGEIFTVLEWINRTDRSYVGDLFETIVVDYPFVIARRLTGAFVPADGKPMVLDMREVNIAEPEIEFIQALLPKGNE